jgi:hypothetical protein
VTATIHLPYRPANIPWRWWHPPTRLGTVIAPLAPDPMSLVFRQVFVSVATVFFNVAANNCVLDDEDLVVVAVVFVVNAEGAKAAVTSTWLIFATANAAGREVSLGRLLEIMKFV